MDKLVLVAFGSKYGATAEIAEKIGAVLRQAGLRAEVASVDGIHDVTSYGAVILGSALYIGKWHKGAEAFLKVNEQALAVRPVWLFSTGPTGEGDPLELVEGQRLPAALLPAAERIQPRDIVVFHGNIDPGKISFMEKWAIKNIVKKPFGDFRDWNSISTWAATIAGALKDGGDAA
jgi:menaquinone-dependent protoporphyrinogen oxidase